VKNSPRLLAVEILNRIEKTDAYAEPLLDAVLAGTAFTNPNDRGLLTELVYGTLRMRGCLDWIIGQFYRGDAAGLDTEVRNILRTGIYQLWYTDRIPPFAAVNEAVGIARKSRPAVSGLVNALLRTALRKKDAIVWPEMAKDPEKAISVLHSHPRWLVERWLDEFGIDETLAICRANNTLPPVALRVNSLKASREQACAALEREGMTAQPTVFSPDGIILTSPAARLRETTAFRDGLIRVQDEASQLIARLTDLQPGERLLDLCAGSGGKTLHLAALMENRGNLTAVDHQSEKLRLLREEAGRLGVTIVETQTADALAPPETFRGIFDRVLLDAPCSALGTLRRNPEIRWRLAPADIEKCSQIQRRLLRSAADCVRPGGRLIYSVCAVTPEENEAVIEDLLNSRTDFSLIKPPIAGGIPHELIDAAGFFRTSPHRHGTDGFFTAVLIRNA
jgi:16S rRNA (cytosine967-C5)-methyltransferase